MLGKVWFSFFFWGGEMDVPDSVSPFQYSLAGLFTCIKNCSYRSQETIVIKMWHIFMSAPGQSDQQRSRVHPVYLSITYMIKLVNTICRKQMNRFLCKLALVVYGAGAWNGQLLGSGGQRSRSHGVEIGWKKTLSARYLKNYPTNFNQTGQVHITVNVHCVRTAWMSKVKVISYEAEERFGGLAETSFCTSSY